MSSCMWPGISPNIMTTKLVTKISNYAKSYIGGEQYDGYGWYVVRPAIKCPAPSQKRGGNSPCVHGKAKSSESNI